MRCRTCAMWPARSTTPPPLPRQESPPIRRHGTRSWPPVLPSAMPGCSSPRTTDRSSRPSTNRSTRCSGRQAAKFSTRTTRRLLSTRRKGSMPSPSSIRSLARASSTKTKGSPCHPPVAAACSKGKSASSSPGDRTQRCNVLRRDLPFMTHDETANPKVLVLPGPTLYRRLFFPDVDAQLRSFADVTFNESDENWTSERLAREIGPYDGLVTCWGSPSITPDVLDASPNVKVIAHSAGSVKHIVKEHVLERGIKVSTAAIAMAPAVAEFSLILTFLGLRPVHEFDFGMRRDGRLSDPHGTFEPGQEIAASRIGVVGAGMVEQLYIQKAKALGADVCVYDPYLSDPATAELEVTKLELDDLFQTCPIIVIHAPT